jgi:hypothetical protein
MRFEWNESKRKSNLKKHGFDFRDTEHVFDGITATFLDDREEYGEDRYITLGLLKGTVVVLVHTEDDDMCRVISMRQATAHEKKLYFTEIRNRLETDSGDDR